MGEGEGKSDGGAEVGAGAGGGDVSAVLAGDGADEEEAEAGAFDADGVAAGDAVEALEDLFLLAGGQADAGVGDGECELGEADDGDGAKDVHAVGRVLDCIVEDVEDGGAEVLRDAADVEADSAGDGNEADGIVG